jgi:initiation factor 1A
MPNLRGGKAYKKGKKPSSDAIDLIGKFFKRDDDQDYARVTKMLGERRAVCFCNDGKERICKIRASMCKGTKKQWISVGDIVLISYRLFGDEDDDNKDKKDSQDKEDGIEMIGTTGRKEIADIINKFHRDHWKFIKQDGVIHKSLLCVGIGIDGEEDIFDYGESDQKEKEIKQEEDIDISAI